MTNDDFPTGPIVLRAPDESLLLRSMRGVEAISTPFHYELELVGEASELRCAEMIGQPIGVSLQAPHAAQPRHFHGLITAFSMVASVSEQATIYRATVRPWLWVLSCKTDCRIFMRQSVPDIVKSIFREHGFSDFDTMLIEEYPALEYVVQYRESDLAFVSRLLESVGIYYYFRHDADAHTLVLLDNRAAHSKNPGCERVPFCPPEASRDALDDMIHRWEGGQALRPGGVTLIDYDFKKSLAYLRADVSTPERSVYGGLEVFDYPGGYADLDAGRRAARLSMQEIAGQDGQMVGTTNARGLLVAGVFEMTEHPLAQYNREYWVTSAQFELHVPEVRSTGFGFPAQVYRCSFVAIAGDADYGPPRRTPKAVIRGPQTATVVGEPGDEILCDEYGRVKIRFHWDRTDASDSNCSCWVRVSQAWAGHEFGAIHIPRVGEEVIVDFLEGDPDRPIIIGRVYNDMNMPPYPLPANQTQSGFKSRSTKGGNPSNFNELRFEDKKGSEHIFVQAEKDLQVLVKNDESAQIGGHRAVRIAKSDSLNVGGSRTVTVEGTRSSTITKKETQTFKADREMKVSGTNLDEVTGAHTGAYHAGRTDTVENGDTLTVKASNKAVTVEGNYETTVHDYLKITKAGTSMQIDDSFAVDATGKIDLHNPGTSMVGEGTTLKLAGNSEVTISCGAASISLKSDGTISIKGSKVQIGNSTCNAAFEPAGTTINGVKITSAAVGVHQLSGAIIKIG